MKLIRKRGDTSNIFQVFIQDSSSTIGAALTGLAFNTSGLTAYFHRDVDTTATAITLATMTVGTFTSSGFKEIDATNMPGWYQFCPPDAALAASSTPHSVGFHLKGATNMAPLAIEVQLIAADLEDTVRLGLTALPNAAANAAGGLPVSAAGALDLDEMNVDIEAIQTSTAGLTYTVANQVDVNVLDWKSATAPAMPTNFSSLSIDSNGLVSITDNIKKNTAVAGFEFMMTDSTTHAPKTGVTVTATRSLDGGAFGACANSVTEIANGFYKIDLAATDTNANKVMLRFTGAGSDDLGILLITQP